MKSNSQLLDYRVCNDSAKYVSIISEKDKKIIIGIPKNFDLKSEEISLIIDNQVLHVDIPDYFIRLKQLSYEKQKIVESIINYFIKKGKQKNKWETILMH